MSIFMYDINGEPNSSINAPVGSGVFCDSSGCTVSSIQGTVKYISRSADGKDTDRITIVPK